MRFICVLLLALTSCDAKVPRYTSTPSWTSARDAKIPTKLGELRLFNATSDYEIDTALVGEIFDRHVSVEKLDKVLELRIFPERYVLPVETPPGFTLTNRYQPGALRGDTVSSSSTRIVICVVPMAWADKVTTYTNKCTGENISAQSEMYLTLTAIHELVGHGAKRSALVPRTENEECAAQALEDRVWRELNGRVAFRRKR